MGALSALVSIEELRSAIAGSLRGKAPGPDDFTVDYYRTFQDQLALRPFVNDFNAILNGHDMPTDLLRANITVIPKPGKDPLLCSS